MYTIRTDLALEANELYSRQAETEETLSGVAVDTDKTDEMTITCVKITNEEGAKALGKPVGSYITLEIPALIHKDDELEKRVCAALADEIKKLAHLKKDGVTLVVGLGNWNITPDAIGPKVVSSLMVTRHMFEHIPEHVGEGITSVCAISPGVLGLTGIETGEIVKGVVQRVKPDLVIAIDALASCKTERVSTTIQLADTGISPGSGVGNARKALNAETLGVPVIAIGVPTVVDALTIANDTIDSVIDDLTRQAPEGSVLYEQLASMDKAHKYQLMQEVLDPFIRDLIVTPKGIDQIADRISKVIANGINLALHENMTLEDMAMYVG